MKQHSDIQPLLLPWIEKKLDNHQLRWVEEHLNGCDACRQYFETMSETLLAESTQRRNTLVPDPFLPTRIKAEARRSATASRSRKFQAVRWSLRTAAFVVAVLFGIYMGERLSYPEPTVTDQHIIAEYSEFIGASGIGDRWQSVALATAEVSR